MKLNTVHRIIPVLQPHYFVAVSVIFNPCGDFQTIGNGLLRHDQTVVSCGGERVRKVGEESLAVMGNFRSLAMHQAIGPNHLGAKNIGQ